MAHANIWIRKRNQATWDALEDKSDYVNACLEAIQEEETKREKKSVPSEQDSIETQLEALNLEYQRPGVAWSSERECDVPYSVFNGKVIL